MKILLVSRGSQGDIYPYLALAKKLKTRGHDVSLNLPFAFEKYAKDAGIPYTVESDDIVGMISNEKLNFKDLLAWTSRVIQQQFEHLIPMVAEHDLFIASNTEFAAPSIAEYTKKRLIRSAYAPLLPSKKIMPAVFPLVKPGFFIRPSLAWALLNSGMNMMAKKQLNARREKLGMTLIKDQAVHAPFHADNLLMYSPILGETDKDWPYRWGISGYCFNDDLPFEETLLEKFLAFIRKDDKPTLFFSLGSINGPLHRRLADWLLETCQKHNYKLVVGCGWWKVGAHLDESGDLFLLDSIIPHHLVLCHCSAIIHHGGSGTTHSAARAGRPQMVIPHIIDQHYWAYRTKLLGLGPGAMNMKNINKDKLEKYVLDLMNNPLYKKNAAEFGERIRAEQGLDHAVDFIEKELKT
ncbi:MAG: glycosyltransferase [Spirochaetaceae bacterium]|jgi:UDP:flavonoid glycosyltransferase YjiC (YdhE family)|nr:glycosyltransferase [Spirochaetaceae bacterium]